MKKFLTIFLLTTILLNILIVLLLFIGRLTFGHGLGDLYNIFWLLIWTIILVIIYFTRNKIFNDAIPLVIVLTIAICISFFITIKGLTVGRGSEYSWNGKIFKESARENEKKESDLLQSKLKAMDSIISMHPEDYITITEKGKLLRYNGFSREAIKEFEKAQKINNNYFEAYHQCALVYGEIKDYKKAVYNYENALRIDPSNQRVKDVILSLKKQYNIK